MCFNADYNVNSWSIRYILLLLNLVGDQLGVVQEFNFETAKFSIGATVQVLLEYSTSTTN